MDQVSQHPIPQDITGFKFRLVGDITLKQFAYLAAGGGLAWFFYSIPLIGIIKFPIILLFALISLILAFLPIQGRPADIMIMLFFKSVFRPNQYTKRNDSTSNSVAQQAIPQESHPLSQPSVQPTQQPIPQVVLPPESQEQQGQKEETHNEPQKSESEHSTDDLLARIKDLEAQLAAHAETKTTSEEENKTPKLNPVQSQQMTNNTSSPIFTPSKPNPDLHADEQKLEKQVDEIVDPVMHQQDLIATSVTPVQKEDNQKSVQPDPLHPPKTPTTPAMPMHDIPNLIEGTVRDPRGNALQNILVEVKDNTDNAVRAFKTSATGDFAASTPLSPGTYTVTFEDPDKKNKFENITITIDNSVQPMLKITSIDDREELRRELFPS